MKDKGNKSITVICLGGGLSGLAASYLLGERAGEAGLPLEITVLEAEDRLGGKIGTLAEDGYMCEIGPNGFLDNKPYTLDLCGQMGIEGRLLRSNDRARKRYIFARERLHCLPEDPVSFMLSDLVSVSGRLRIAMEYFVPRKKKDGADETLAEFVRRRLGQEALEMLIDPMASGIFAGDPENMSLAACFPKIVALEENYGGLIRGMLAMKKAAAREGRQGPDSAGPGGVLMSFRNGLQELIDSLAERIGGRIITSARATKILRGKDGRSYRVVYDDPTGEQAIEAAAVILAVPAYDGALLVGNFDSGLASTMEGIGYASMAVVHAGFPESALSRPLDGFGYLIPHREKRRILGSLWASSIFEGRSPEGNALLTTMIGGAKDPKTPMLDDEGLKAVVLEELSATMGVGGEPAFCRILKWEKAIPQYKFGHPQLVASLEKRLGDHPGLFLTGNAYRGIGVNDCVASGQKVADEAFDYLKELAS